MYRTLLKSKIHRATVTRTNLHYVGSITIDEDLIEQADMLENELVQIVNINTGARFDTYVIPGQRGSGCMELNGAAARLAEPGDLIIVMSFGLYSETELKGQKATVVLVNDHNALMNHIDSESQHNQELRKQEDAGVGASR